MPRRSSPLLEGARGSEQLQTVIHIQPQVPFSLDDDKSCEQPFRPKCLQEIIQSLQELLSPNS